MLINILKLNYFTTYESQKAAPLTYDYDILSMLFYIIMLLVLPFKSWFYRQDIYFLKGLFRHPFSIDRKRWSKLVQMDWTKYERSELNRM